MEERKYDIACGAYIYPLIMEGLPDAFLLSTPEGSIVNVNKAALEMFGYSKEEFMIMSGKEIFDYSDPGFLKLTQVRDEERAIKGRAIGIRKNKERFSIEIANVIARNENGEEFIASVVSDISQKILHEELMKSSEEKYKYLFVSNPMAIIVWDIFSLKVLDVNDTAGKEYGHTKEDFMKMSVLDIRPDEEKNVLKKFADQFARAEYQKLTGVWRHINKKGEEMLMEVTSHKIIFNGKVAVMEMATNVSDKMRLAKNLEEEKALKQKQITEAVVAAQEKERYEISQELHDNVNQLLIAARIYIESAKKNEDKKTELLDQASKFVLKGIEEIRKLSKALITPMVDDMSLQEAIESLARDIVIANPIKIKTIITSFIEDDISDKFKLNVYRIVQEQLNNIIKHSQATSAEIHLSRNSHEVKILILDNGVGFDTSQKSKGVGISNIIRRAELYNGFVDIQSVPGNGCKLDIRFIITHSMMIG